MRTWMGLALFLLLMPAIAGAQLVINPTRVEFMVSADHGVVLPDNSPAVTRYEIRFFASGASAPQQVSDLGKPTPDGTGKAAVDITQTIVAFPISPTTQYTAKVAAIGPAGEGVSADSNPFVRAAPPQAASAVKLVRP